MNFIFAALGALFFIIMPVTVHASAAATVTSPFRYTFNSLGTLYETGREVDSTSPYFWLTSGAKLEMKNGLGQTIQGALPTNDPSRIWYAGMNPLDSQNGYYPQNTFRLITRSPWGNDQTTLQFKVTKTNLTNSPNRDVHNGVMFMSRYTDPDNLYYAGIRVDGLGIIKKKIGGEYHTLVYDQVFGTNTLYNKTTNPNLIPLNHWIGMRLKTTNVSGGVKLELLVDRNNTGVWESVVTYIDTGVGGAPFTSAGRIGIRSDFMDVQFDNLDIRTL